MKPFGLKEEDYNRIVKALRSSQKYFVEKIKNIEECPTDFGERLTTLKPILSDIEWCLKCLGERP